jgi:hypothetical protein
MLGSAILESAIGTIVVYIMLSLVCSVLNEWVTRLQSLRSAMLAEELRKLLGPNLAGALSKHPLIRGMFERGRFPNYLPASTFALTFIQLGYDYTPGTGGLPGTTAVQARWSGPDEKLLDGLRQNATSLGPLQTRIEKWFDLAMEQTSGRFKRQTQIYILAISGAIVGGAAVDTISIASHLYVGALNHLPSYFAIGWSDHSGPLWQKICGILLTWGAVSLGAPFWFDVLNKLVNLRQTGLPPDEDKREAAAMRFVAQ